MPVDDRTTYKNYPKPNQLNTLVFDVARLRAALDSIDADINVLDTSGGGIPFFVIDASEFIPRTTAGCGIDSQETATNRINRDLLAFDPGASEHAQTWFVWPTGWTTARVTFFWKASSGTGSVVFGAQMRVYTDADAEDQVFGTAQTVTDAAASANTHRQTAATAGITPGGTVTAGRLTCLQVYRDAANGSDDLAVDALLQSVLVERAS